MHLLNDGSVGTRRDGLQCLDIGHPPILRMFRIAQRNGYAALQSQRKRVFKIERDAGRIHFSESRQNLVDLRPLQIDQHPLCYAGFFDDFSARGSISMLAPFQTAGYGLPKPGRPTTFEQQVFAALRMNDDQN